MKAIHCIDMSGSMSNEQIDRAKQEVKKRFIPGDVVCVFDIRFVIVTDLDRDLRDYMPYSGGTCAKAVLEFAKTQNAYSFLYSDGYLLEEELAQFSEIVKV